MQFICEIKDSFPQAVCIIFSYFTESTQIRTETRTGLSNGRHENRMNREQEDKLNY